MRKYSVGVSITLFEDFDVEAENSREAKDDAAERARDIYGPMADVNIDWCDDVTDEENPDDLDLCGSEPYLPRLSGMGALALA